MGAAGLYVLAPLRLRELFIQGNLSQLVALSLLPWALWALVWAARKASLRWAALAGAILAALLYAHHASAFLAYPLLLVLAFAVAVFDSQATGLRRFAPLVLAFGLALALSAPFWLPWLVESSYGSLGRIESGMFNAALNLLPADELFSPSLPLDASSINSPLPNTLGLVQAILAAVGTITCAVMLWRSRKTQPERGRLAVLLTARRAARALARADAAPGRTCLDQPAHRQVHRLPVAPARAGRAVCGDPGRGSAAAAAGAAHRGPGSEPRAGACRF